ncbi:probable LRR receptor-like serine/threonine-protein kinase At1g53430 isoform X2 [Beta vulgaris subsp. vulgaris]|uniref:probable LRR receptor-like serine/threonine-protein kinase At1g53430 isoform X2 n=1 Tax=Beta vulgaris subsp. vulgaris TaxID=3555 RepID=UPI0020371F39|nr:probable LRR receptor-like serine/threonine-protein kinase At1g53430 isoform X2 [Beta vulgaris subsp. vulgaris]
MAASLSKSMLLFQIACLSITFFIKLRSNAQLIPQDEVTTLKVISEKLENTYWKVITQKSCSDGGRSFNKTYARNILSNVTCDCSFNSSTLCHVTHIQLKGLNLTGLLPEEFGDLTHLQEIDLSRNYVSGPIPKSLSKIPLVTLSLLGNHNTGPIPENIGQITTLEELILEDNQLGGPLPKSLGNLKNLRRLVLAGNFFNGTIPDTFVKLKNLTELRLSGNAISGKIPDFLAILTSLQSFDIQGTSMEGPIPSTFSNLTNLQILRISDLNTRSISFPNLTDMKNLTYLVLRNCSITGPIPNFVGNLANLKLIDLSYNRLSGQIPESMQPLPLNYLFLTNNSLSGILPSWILNSKQYFDVSYNNFTGSSPASCQQSNVNLVASYSSAKSNVVNWCLRRDLPCSTKPQHYSLFINCGGNKMNFQRNEYEEDSSPGGPSTFFANGEKWAYSSTGAFLYTEQANFLAMETSNPNVTDIYQTARLAPLSLKYYGLCLLQGSYKVKLHFAEIMFSDDGTFDNNGRRFFDVAIQGDVKLKDFDIEAAAGGAGKPVTREFDVYVNGSTLEIYLYWAGRGTTGSPDRGAYGPLISGISVTPNFKIKKKGVLSAGAIAGIVLASCAIVVAVPVFLWLTGYLCGKDQEDEELRKLGTGYFTLKQIKAATDDFDHRNKIGEGGFGPVFKGVLPDSKVIAVKQLSSKSKQGNREFVNEIGMISALQHPNLVKLYGCCIEGKELLLVYEYMENNSLARALFGRENQKLQLDWQTRMSICLGIAKGLAYLHEESRLKIVHRDIKATNVLLDKELNAKISDFGLAKLDEDENTHISTRIAGTIGYMAPEYAMRGYLTDKADVYSFGVVVLEIVSGTSNTSYRPKEEFVYLLDWAYVLQEQGNLLELVDPSLGSSYSKEEALRLLNIALLCTNPSPSLRPSMSSVMSMIEGQSPVQAPIVKRTGMNDELRFRAFERLSQDSQTHVSGSSMSSHVQRSMSIDGPWTDSSISMHSKDEFSVKSPSTSKLLPDNVD